MLERIKNFFKKESTEEEMLENVYFMDGMIFALTLVILMIIVISIIKKLM